MVSTDIHAPICMACKRLKGLPENWVWICEAYPDGIPEAIILSQVDHRQPYAGDHGLQFLPKDRKAAEIADRLLA